MEHIHGSCEIEAHLGPICNMVQNERGRPNSEHKRNRRRVPGRIGEVDCIGREYESKRQRQAPYGAQHRQHNANEQVERRLQHDDLTGTTPWIERLLPIHR